MVALQTVCLRKLGHQRSGEVRFGRWLRNWRVSVKALIEGVCGGISKRVQGRHVLLLEDTSEINYQAHAGRVEGLGKVGNGKDVGFFLHPVLAVDAQEYTCLGLAHLHLWLRSRKKEPGYQKLPIEDKESGRWIEAAQRGLQRTAQAGMATVIADREADIYDMFDRLPDPGNAGTASTHLLIRACRDRSLAGLNDAAPNESKTLYGWLSGLPEQDRYEVDLPASQSKGKDHRSAHRAQLVVRFGRTQIQRPQYAVRSAPKAIALWAIDVCEDASTVVGQEKPVHWRLLTTHEIASAQQARQCIDWYRQRWHIEQMFRTLKQQGLDVQSSQLEEAGRLQKLVVLAASAAVHTLQLTLAREGHNTRPASDCFNEQEQVLLKDVNPTLEGATVKQHNPHTVASLAWAAWIVARLGGWKGYASERKPGPITMLNGLKALAQIHRGWALARGVG
jgi:Transposase DDE domain